MARNSTSSVDKADSHRLADYKSKRNFDTTPDPVPRQRRSRTGRRFVIQKHRASHLHYDLRLEVNGVLKSWAVPKGPSLNPKDKRLAMAVEDHPLDYAQFEGVIPEGEYGGGTVMVWDQGTYTPENDAKDVARGISKGELKFSLNGTKVNGSWVLVRTRGRQWLLIKHRDAFASDEPVTESQARSVLSDRTLAEIAADEGGNVTKAATGDPPEVAPRKPAHPASRRVRQRSTGSAARSLSARSVARHRGSENNDIQVPEGARPAAMPRLVNPMLATLVDEPFSSRDWIYETKWDGVRTICYLRDGKYRLASRRQSDVTTKYPELSHITNVVKATRAILDGEIVALDVKGVPRFQLLQHRFGLKTGPGVPRQRQKLSIVYYVFDLVYLDGYDLTRVGLIDRKALLSSIIRKDPAVRYSDHVVGNGIEFFQSVKKLQLEGMIAKRSDSIYMQSRSRNWLKVKTAQRSEVVIGGYTKPRGSRGFFGALVVGQYDNGKLRYVGHTGGGFDRAGLKQVYDLMQPLKIGKSPFSPPPKTNEPVQWIKPQVVCEVKFSEWTEDGIMRMPIFVGLREDKDPKQCTVERKAHTEEIVDAKPGEAS